DPAETAAMVSELETWIAGGGAAAPAIAQDDDFDFRPVTVELDEPDGPKVWKITFQPASALYANANDSGILLRELSRLGAIEVELLDDALPAFDVLAPEASYLAWTVHLTTEADEAEIREVFEFVESDCAITIGAEAAVQTPLAPPALEGDEFGFVPQRIDLGAVGSAEEGPAATAPEVEASPASDTPAPSRALRPQAVEAAAQATIRVDPERIDRLIDLVGELVINQAMLAQRVAGHGFAPSSDVAMGLDELEQLTRGIQDSVMAIRAQPVKSVFQRMPRLVREVAGQTGKQVRLVMEGEATEVDKTVIERISDPITHMLRNAIDHGLESAEARLAAGKPAEGLVRLAALHRGGRIVIEVEDDGGGIDRARVRQIAIDKGLVAADTPLTEEETDNLIFLPGFSTAKAVSDISGRGVGMDVVRRSVQALGGRISISSRPGRGSTFTLSLPLTL
ncbi:MAG: chemotaxis protein CheA, partial [Proteobacteria bacterium]|nr:chemotaxis protein CheA [Pseudomonadota bacterium]